MTRTKEDVVNDLEQIRKLRFQIEEQEKNLKAELEAFDNLEDRFIDVSWKTFYNVVVENFHAWKEIEVNDPYESRNDCSVQECWYKGNLDRLNGLELYVLEDFPENIVCDVCMNNNFQCEVFSSYSDDDTVDINLKYYSEAIQEQLIQGQILNDEKV